MVVNFELAIGFLVEHFKRSVQLLNAQFLAAEEAVTKIIAKIGVTKKVTHGVEWFIDGIAEQGFGGLSGDSIPSHSCRPGGNWRAYLGLKEMGGKLNR